MALNMRLSKDDPRLYNPARDIAHCFPGIVQATARELERRRWTALASLSVSDDELADACEAYTTFVMTAVDHPQEDMRSALERCGWYRLTADAQLAYLATLGSVVAGVAWCGVHEVTLGGEGPLSRVEDLAAAGREASRLLRMPPWQRKLSQLVRQLKRYLAAKLKL